jgi:tetratricopeptide (TPR) repeat protein
VTDYYRRFSSALFIKPVMSRRPGKPQQVVAAPPPAKGFPWPAGWICALIFVVTLLAYLPALNGGFIWDDAGHVTRADLRSLAGLGRIWFEIGATQQYYPLLHSVFWLEHLIWGDSTLGYHLFNVLLHASTACLFGVLLRRLSVPGAWFAALLFALHPVCVESVAWISEQKNTLSSVFYLTAALAYLRFDEHRSRRSYALAGGWFILALLTKTVTATLPAALLVIFWWQRGRLDWRRDVLPLLPWFVLGAASGLFTAHFERELIGAQGADFDLGALQRCLLAGHIVWFYLGKLLWPAELIFVYPHWTVDAGEFSSWAYLVSALALLGGLVWWRRQSRGPLAAGLLFAGTLFPVLGFFNIFPFLFSYVADHFQYLASLAFFALAAAGMMRIAATLPQWARSAAGAALLAGFGALSWRQCGMYRDLPTLYQTTIDRNPACWMAYTNLAIEYTDAGRPADAIPLLERALKLRPDYAQAENNLGDALMRLGQPPQAIPHFERAVRLEPRYYQAYNNLGVALRAANRTPESLAEFKLALKHQPDFPEAEHNLGLALAELGRTNEALPHFERAVQLNPDYAGAELSWAIGLMLTDRFPEAVLHFEKAVALDPDSIEIRSTYGRALMRAGRFEEAIPQFEHVLQLNSGLAEEHMNLALVLRQLGRIPEASRHYLEAVRLNPALGHQTP